jgi:hypothetical protein
MTFKGGELVNKKGANAFCDRTGFVCKRSDLRKQMKWQGTDLVWTGLWVHKDFLDIPNPSMRTIILPPDPVPVSEPRHGLGLDAPVPTQDAGTQEQRLNALNNINSTTNGLIF